MYIIHVGSELAPLSKVGGLADVISGLSKETARCGHRVEIILPKYDCINYDLLKNLKVEFRELISFEGPYRYANTIWSAKVEELNVLLIEPHHPNYYFNRGKIYGCQDDIDRFSYFSRAALEYLLKANKHPDVLHIHDWPTALCAPLYKDMYLSLGLKIKKVILTIHNLEHQGKCAPFHLTRSGLRGENYLLQDRMGDPHSPGLINLLKGGIMYANQVTTVSPTYEQEIKTPLGGCGLNEILASQEKKLKGILNGIDENVWNPIADPYIVKHYSTYQIKSADQLKAVKDAKKENKKYLLSHFGLKKENIPLVACVSRLVPQKGPELIEIALKRVLEKGGIFIFLGSAGTQEIMKKFEQLEESFKSTKRVKIHLIHDESVAHLIFASADMLIVPSLFEPCGLTQMIAMRYGTVPLVRKTGGLADTVFDIDTSEQPESVRNGFTFDFPDIKGVHWVIDRALECWLKNEQKWDKILMRGIEANHSWKQRVLDYLTLYTS